MANDRLLPGEKNLQQKLPALKALEFTQYFPCMFVSTEKRGPLLFFQKKHFLQHIRNAVFFPSNPKKAFLKVLIRNPINTKWLSTKVVPFFTIHRQESLLSHQIKRTHLAYWFSTCERYVNTTLIVSDCLTAQLNTHIINTFTQYFPGRNKKSVSPNSWNYECKNPY